MSKKACSHSDPGGYIAVADKLIGGTTTDDSDQPRKGDLWRLPGLPRKLQDAEEQPGNCHARKRPQGQNVLEISKCHFEAKMTFAMNTHVSDEEPAPGCRNTQIFEMKRPGSQNGDQEGSLPPVGPRQTSQINETRILVPKSNAKMLQTRLVELPGSASKGRLTRVPVGRNILATAGKHKFLRKSMTRGSSRQLQKHHNPCRITMFWSSRQWRGLNSTQT